MGCTHINHKREPFVAYHPVYNEIVQISQWVISLKRFRLLSHKVVFVHSSLGCYEWRQSKYKELIWDNARSEGVNGKVFRLFQSIFLFYLSGKHQNQPFQILKDAELFANHQCNSAKPRCSFMNHLCGFFNQRCWFKISSTSYSVYDGKIRSFSPDGKDYYHQLRKKRKSLEKNTHRHSNTLIMNKYDDGVKVKIGQFTHNKGRKNDSFCLYIFPKYAGITSVFPLLP